MKKQDAKPKHKPEPATIFLIAEQYYTAAQALALPPEVTDYPSMVCSSFALELYFKSLILFEGKELRIEHNLKVLFSRLSPPTQAKIRSRFLRHLPDAQHIADESAKAAGKVAPVVDFDYVLTISQNGFTLMRYIYEGSPISTGWMAGAIVTSTRETILDLKPEWATRKLTRGTPSIVTVAQSP